MGTSDRVDRQVHFEQRGRNEAKVKFGTTFFPSPSRNKITLSLLRLTSSKPQFSFFWKQVWLKGLYFGELHRQKSAIVKLRLSICISNPVVKQTEVWAYYIQQNSAVILNLDL